MPGIRQHDTREGGGADSLGLDISRTVLARSALRAPGIATPPGFAIAAGLLLALGIGVTTAIFAVLNAVALRPLPYADPSRLVWITQVLRGSSTDELTITADFLDWRRLNHNFTHLAAYNHQVRNLTGVEPPVEVHTARASASLLPMLGVIPAIGRNFHRDEDIAGNHAVALLAYNFWQQQFGGNRSVIGQPIPRWPPVHDYWCTPREGFVFPGSDPVDLLTPLAKNEPLESQRGQNVSIIFDVLGRLKRGVTLEQAHAELTSLQAHLPNFLPWHPQITIRMLPFVTISSAMPPLRASCCSALPDSCCSSPAPMSVIYCWSASRNATGNSLSARCWADRAPGMLATILFGVLAAFRATGLHLAEAIKGGASGVVGGRKSMRILSLVAAAEVAMTLVLSSGET